MRLPIAEYLFRRDHYGMLKALTTDCDIASAVGSENILVCAGVEMQFHASSPFADLGALG